MMDGGCCCTMHTSSSCAQPVNAHADCSPAAAAVAPSLLMRCVMGCGPRAAGSQSRSCSASWRTQTSTVRQQGQGHQAAELACAAVCSAFVGVCCAQSARVVGSSRKLLLQRSDMAPYISFVLAVIITACSESTAVSYLLHCCCQHTQVVKSHGSCGCR
jgi:hypothetical protein